MQQDEYTSQRLKAQGVEGFVIGNLSFEIGSLTEMANDNFAVTSMFSSVLVFVR